MAIINNTKSFIRDLITDSLWQLGLTNPQTKSKNKLTVVTFHRVLPDAMRKQYPYEGICVTPEELDWFCTFFAHYDAVGPLTDIYEQWKENTDPNKTFLAITFDDAQWDNLRFAQPVLEKHGYKATFYIPTESVDDNTLLWHDRLGYIIHQANSSQQLRDILKLFSHYGYVDAEIDDLKSKLVEFTKTLSVADRKDLLNQLEADHTVDIPDWGRLMSWDEIRSLDQQGHEIGAHSVTHELLTGCDPKQLKHEVEHSKTRIEAELSKTINSFCYPNGNHNASVIQAVNVAAYDNAVTTVWGINDRDVETFAIKRFDINTFNNTNRHHKLSTSRFAYRLMK